MATTKDLQEQFDKGMAEIAIVQERLRPIHDELSKRSNADVTVLNMVMAGQAEALRTMGVPAENIKKAEDFFAEEKARKSALRPTEAPDGKEVPS